jgi:hypothetical protein
MLYKFNKSWCKVDFLGLSPLATSFKSNTAKHQQKLIWTKWSITAFSLRMKVRNLMIYNSYRMGWLIQMSVSQNVKISLSNAKENVHAKNNKRWAKIFWDLIILHCKNINNFGWEITRTKQNIYQYCSSFELITSFNE